MMFEFVNKIASKNTIFAYMVYSNIIIISSNNFMYFNVKRKITNATQTIIIIKDHKKKFCDKLFSLL